MATDCSQAGVWCRWAASGASPALPGELPQGCRGLAVDRHLNIMQRPNPFEFGENGQELVDAMDAHMPAENGLSPMLG